MVQSRAVGCQKWEHCSCASGGPYTVTPHLPMCHVVPRSPEFVIDLWGGNPFLGGERLTRQPEAFSSHRAMSFRGQMGIDATASGRTLRWKTGQWSYTTRGAKRDPPRTLARTKNMYSLDDRPKLWTGMYYNMGWTFRIRTRLSCFLLFCPSHFLNFYPSSSR